MNNSSLFIHADNAKQAVLYAAPSIEAALTQPHISGLGVLHLVLLDPTVTASSGTTAPVVLYEHSIGDKQRWDVDYAAYAHAKALLSWRHAMDSRRLQLLEPHRLLKGDSLLWGGVWLEGLVVAASGAMPIWDEAFAMSVALHLRAIAWEQAALARDGRA